jgi:DNA/RNA-binding protein KIN17
VQIVTTGKRAKFAQKDLETVIPQVGREVLVMKGEFSKKTGILKEIQQKQFRILVDVKLSDDESTEVLFRFDEVSKKYEKKKKNSVSA